MKLITTTRPTFTEATFTIEMTGAELLHLFMLSYKMEGGDHFPQSGRITDLVRDLVPEDLKPEFATACQRAFPGTRLSRDLY